jgi:hypothetical protein
MMGFCQSRSLDANRCVHGKNLLFMGWPVKVTRVQE